MKRPRFIVPGLVAVLAIPSVPAQSVPAQQASLAPAGETIELSPFTVTETPDTGYAATNSLAGSRLNTDLKDIAASISVFTEDFMSDIGATDIEEVLVYANNLEFELGDSANDGAPNLNALISDFQGYRVRGLPATVARNYFEWNIPTDSYNTTRIEDSRGPNAVLFGIAQAGGLINSATKQPLTGRSFRKASLRYGSHDSFRATVDVNQKAADGKFAVRLNAVHDDAGNFRHFAFDKDQRVHLGVKFVPWSSTTIRAEIEAGTIERNITRPFNLTDGVTTWLAAGRPTLDAPVPNNKAPAGTIQLNAKTARVTYLGDTGQLLNMSGRMITSGNQTIIMDPAMTDESINVSGPGTLQRTDFDSQSVFLEQRLARDTFIEVAYNHQDYRFDAYDATVSSSDLLGDPNNFLPGGAENPHAGDLMLESSWFRATRDEEYDTLRAILTTRLNAGKWGDFRVVGLGEYQDTRRETLQLGEFWEDRPFNATPENGANQVWRRNYVTEGDWGTYHVGSDVADGPIVGMLDPISGRTLSSTWLVRQAPVDAQSKQKSWMVGLQARHFDGRLVTNLGYRRESLDTRLYQSTRDLATNELTIDPATWLDTDFSGSTRSLGVVAHVLPQISLLANYATNVGLPNPSTRVLGGGPEPAREGEGEDVGVAVTLFDGRVYARAVYFETAGKNYSGPRGMNAVTNTNDRVLDALMASGLITQAQADARSTGGANRVRYDLASSGYEFQITANPTRNWRFVANYSTTDAGEDNIDPELKAWAADNFAFWQTFDQSIVTSNGRTIAQELANVSDQMEENFALEGLTKFGHRKHKVSFFTRYAFSSGPLQGFSIGGGAFHQSKTVMGLIGLGTPEVDYDYGNSFSRVDAMLGYDVHWAPEWMNLKLQLNVLNVLDDTDPRILRVQGAERFVRRLVLTPPREWRLTANLEF